jgi:hypothetical protein
LQGMCGCIFLPFRLVFGCLGYVGTLSFSTAAPQRRARRAADRLCSADIEQGNVVRRACTNWSWVKAQKKRHPPKLVVFVDDLDRIQPLKVASILEAINIVLQARRAWGVVHRAAS